MTEIEELRCEIDVLRGRLNAAEGVMGSIADGLASMLEFSGVISREQIGHAILMNVRLRRAHGDGSSVELDLIEHAGERLLLPSEASITITGPMN